MSFVQCSSSFNTFDLRCLNRCFILYLHDLQAAYLARRCDAYGRHANRIRRSLHWRLLGKPLLLSSSCIPPILIPFPDTRRLLTLYGRSYMKQANTSTIASGGCHSTRTSVPRSTPATLIYVTCVAISIFMYDLRLQITNAKAYRLAVDQEDHALRLFSLKHL